MFHFAKNEKKKETDLIKRIIATSRPTAIIVFCIQDTGKKVDILNKIIDDQGKLGRFFETDLQYEFRDSQTGHSSRTDYQMIVIQN
jgi:hypothetical protein